MSNPDTIIKLKAKVEVYESELQETMKAIQENPRSGTPTQQMMWVSSLLKFLDINSKLLVAYREYTKEIEKLIPR